MTTGEAKEKIIDRLIGRELSLYTAMYAPDKYPLSTNELIGEIKGLTKYRARVAIHELEDEGMVEYTSQGFPAVVSCGEYAELVCEARPPKNGYTLTEKAFDSDRWKDAYAAWNKSMEEWANGGNEEDAES